MTRPSAWHVLGRALGMIAALPARAVGLAVAYRPRHSPCNPNTNRKDR